MVPGRLVGTPELEKSISSDIPTVLSSPEQQRRWGCYCSHVLVPATRGQAGGSGGLVAPGRGPGACSLVSFAFLRRESHTR